MDVLICGKKAGERSPLPLKKQIEEVLKGASRLDRHAWPHEQVYSMQFSADIDLIHQGGTIRWHSTDLT